MSVTSSSPRAVALEALAAGEAALPAYSHPCSPRKFTQPQLFACLVLKAFFKTDYRGVVQFLADFGELRDDLGLQEVPHYSTLCYAEQRLLKRGTSSSSSYVPLRPQLTAA